MQKPKPTKQQLEFEVAELQKLQAYMGRRSKANFSLSKKIAALLKVIQEINEMEGI